MDLGIYPTERVTRFEVIDHTEFGTGRILVRNGIRIELEFQDKDRTLKVFIHDNEENNQTD